MSANIEVLRVEIARLQLQPGDILVIRIPAFGADIDLQELERFLPADIALLVLPLKSEIETIHGTRVDHDHTDQP